MTNVDFFLFDSIFNESTTNKKDLTNQSAKSFSFFYVVKFLAFQLGEGSPASINGRFT